MTMATLGAWCALSPAAAAAESGPVRFVPIDIYVDSAEVELGAYQVEVMVSRGDAQIVGVEGGEHPAYKRAPYYDAKALMSGRIILAAFSTADELPRGKHRVLTLHVRESGGPAVYKVVSLAAANREGKRAKVTFMAERRATKR